VYNAALTACERCSQWVPALQIHAEMMRSTESKPNSITYAVLLATMEAADRGAERGHLAASMPGREADDVLASYAALIHTWSGRHARKSMKRF
jgi:hypothetical protein